MKNITIITAAGGNATAIAIIPFALDQDGYSNKGKELMSRTEQYGVEQCGFLIPKANHFEMSGGEFCGNAARAVAILFSRINGTENVIFSMSGLIGRVTGHVQPKKKGGCFDVSCIFEGMHPSQRDIQAAGSPAKLVDLGGIVHVVVEADLPEDYEVQHRRITQELELTQRPAVGVCWVKKGKKNDAVIMHPVVWVRGIDSFFYESSCGSGSIATAQVCNVSSIVQPTGQQITVDFTKNTVTLQSEMEVTHEFEEL